MNNLRFGLGSLARLSSTGALLTRAIHTSPAVFRAKKHEKSKEIVIPHNLCESKSPIIQEAWQQMQESEEVLRGHLCRRFSTKVDLRTYEDVMVKTDKGDVHKMSLLGRVTLKTPQMVMINLADNPSAIKWAKLALQKLPSGLNPQQEGVVLYIPIPAMTRQRRDEIANDHTVFNEYKKALNDVGSPTFPSDKKCNKIHKTDLAHGTHNGLLALKKAMEDRGQEILEEKRREVLREVI